MAKVSLEKDKIKFLLVEGVHQKAIDSLRAAGYTNIEFHKGALDTEELKAAIRDAHFIGLRSRTHLTEDVIAAAEKLVAIGCFCIGTNQVDLNAAAKRGIPVFNAPFSNTRSVAELVIGELLLLLRGIPEANAKAHRGVWNKLKVREEHTLPSLGATLFTVLLPIGLMLVKTIAELNMAKEGSLYTLLEFIGNPITAMFIAVFVAYYLLGIRQHMSMGAMLTHTEHGFGSIANILLIIGAGGAFNAILKTSGLADSLAHILSNLHMHPILLAWLVALVLHAAVGSATVAMMGATAIVAPMLPLYPKVSPEIITIAIGSGAIGCTIVTDSLFWLVKQYCGATLNETFKYYTTATFIASVLALGGTFLLSFII